MASVSLADVVRRLPEGRWGEVCSVVKFLSYIRVHSRLAFICVNLRPSAVKFCGLQAKRLWVTRAVNMKKSVAKPARITELKATILQTSPARKIVCNAWTK